MLIESDPLPSIPLQGWIPMKSGDLFRLAELHYATMRKNNNFISDPDYIKFPLDLPYFNGVFVTVNSGHIKEIEIHYRNGSIQTVRPVPG
jgi:hypothetical protein